MQKVCLPARPTNRAASMLHQLLRLPSSPDPKPKACSGLCSSRIMEIFLESSGSACKCKLYHGENHTSIRVRKLSQKLNAFCHVCGSPGESGKFHHEIVCIYRPGANKPVHK